MKNMESGSALSNLVVMECEKDLRQTDRISRQRNIKAVIIYSVIIAMMTLLSINTVILEEKREDRIIPNVLQTRTSNLEKSKKLTVQQTLCPYSNKLPLSEDIYVLICDKEEKTSIDIRKFNGPDATVEGIQLNINQWLYLRTVRRQLHSTMKDTPRESDT